MMLDDSFSARILTYICQVPMLNITGLAILIFLQSSHVILYQKCFFYHPAKKRNLNIWEKIKLSAAIWHEYDSYLC